MPSPLPQLPPREPDSHKGTFGRVVLIGGSKGMAGSIALAGMAALRSGAGLVSIAAPDAVIDLVASFHPCFMTIPLPSDLSGKVAASAVQKIWNAIENANCVAIGPGLGRSPELDAVVGKLILETRCPLVIDADGINAITLSKIDVARIVGPRIFTPHPGEFERLTGVSAKSRKDQVDAAVQLARRATGRLF